MSSKAFYVLFICMSVCLHDSLVHGQQKPTDPCVISCTVSLEGGCVLPMKRRGMRSPICPPNCIPPPIKPIRSLLPKYKKFPDFCAMNCIVGPDGGCVLHMK